MDEGNPTETYGARALILIATIEEIATSRIDAALRAREAKAQTKHIQRMKITHVDHLIRLAKARGGEVDIVTLYDHLARQLRTAYHATAVRAWIDDTIAAGSSPGSLRDAIVDTALERGYNARDAVAIARVAMLPQDRRASELLTAAKGTDVAGERSAQRRRKKLLAQREAQLRGISVQLASARARRGMYGAMDAKHVPNAIRSLECERIACWYLIDQLGGVPIAARSRISRGRGA